ncbi:MAG: thiol-disulfide oxidoreductase DCC family protein [Flavisolibacter sp.]
MYQPFGRGPWTIEELSEFYSDEMTNHPIVLFDGVCNLCNASVNFLIRQDKKNVFRFATLQSETGKKLLGTHHPPNYLNHSFILIDRGKSYEKSSAALKLVNHLPWYWKTFKIFWIIPPFIRNFVYDFIARNRYRWFGRKDVCMVPSPSLKDKFLD